MARKFASPLAKIKYNLERIILISILLRPPLALQSLVLPNPTLLQIPSVLQPLALQIPIPLQL